MRKPRCYVVENRKGHDISKAAEFGDIVVLYPKKIYDIFMVSKHAHVVRTLLADAEKGDYLIAGGNVILMLIAFGVLLEKFGSVNLLLCDVRTLDYVPRVIAKHQLKGGIDG
jgi:hypothetical protein